MINSNRVNFSNFPSFASVVNQAYAASTPYSSYNQSASSLMASQYYSNAAAELAAAGYNSSSDKTGWYAPACKFQSQLFHFTSPL